MEAFLIVALIVAAAMLWSSLGPRGGWTPIRRGGGKRCSRCWRSVGDLRPYIDARQEFWICGMCAAEMDFTHASHLDLPRR
jgi:hypothetical protein